MSKNVSCCSESANETISEESDGSEREPHVCKINQTNPDAVHAWTKIDIVNFGGYCTQRSSCSSDA